MTTPVEAKPSVQGLATWLRIEAESGGVTWEQIHQFRAWASAVESLEASRIAPAVWTAEQAAQIPILAEELKQAFAEAAPQAAPAQAEMTDAEITALWNTEFVLPAPGEPVTISPVHRFANAILSARKVPTTARAFEIADDAMYVQLRSHGWKRGGNAEVQYVYPPSPDSSSAAEVTEAVEWLLPRGFLERGEDAGGSFVRVLREPGEAG